MSDDDTRHIPPYEPRQQHLPPWYSTTLVDEPPLQPVPVPPRQPSRIGRKLATGAAVVALSLGSGAAGAGIAL